MSKPIGNKTKNVRCVECNNWVPIPGWARSRGNARYGSPSRYKDAVIRCPKCKAFNDITIDHEL